jgi:RHS repeat-associated protein
MLLRAVGRVRSLLVVLLVPALVVGLVASVQFVVAPRAAKAHADVTTGTAGLFTPLTARVMDTRNGTGGYSTPMAAGTWRTLPIDGVGGVPSSGVSAVAITMTVIGAAAAGQARAMPTGSSVQPVVALYYGDGSTGDQSGSAISAVGSDGTIQVVTGTAIDLVVDVQGYFTSGNGITAAGGYVPIAPVRIVSTTAGTGVPVAQLANGSTTTITVGGANGVPADASGVFVTLTPRSYTTGSPWLTVWPAGTTRPGTSLDFPGNTNYAIGANADLNTSGQMSIYVGASSAPIDLTVDVIGYYAAASVDGQGAFTPAATRVYDSRISPNIAIPGNGTRTVRIGGVAGVPIAGAGVSSVAMSLLAIHSATNPGNLRIWADDQAEPTTTAMLNYASGVGSIRSDFQITRLGADGGVTLRNSGADPVHVVIDIQGWFATVGTPITTNQTRTQSSVTLQASANGGGAWVTYKYRSGTTASFVNVPTTYVTGTPTWPVTKTAGVFTAYTWDVLNTLRATTGLTNPPDTVLQVEACYGVSSTDANPLCSIPTNLQWVRNSFGSSDATTTVGPGSLSLLTGNYSVSATDASVPSYLGSLSIGRSFTTLSPTADLPAATGVFGPGWTADLTGPDAGDADLTVTDTSAQGYLAFTGSDGASSVYQLASPAGTYPLTFAGINDASADGSSVAMTNASTITMTEQDATVTTWTGSGTSWRVLSVVQAGNATTTTYSVDGAGRINRILGAVPTGISCASPDTTAGCRSMTLTYTTVASKSRLQSVNYVAYNPAKTPTAGMDIIEVAHYDYDATGQLLDSYDPRISPNLKTAYTYNTQHQLATLTPPGLASWNFSYDATGRLSMVYRADPVLAQTAYNTIAYGVPVSGGSAPINLTSTAMATWGQTADLPTTATAVFGPDHQPATTPTATDWPYASISYLDINGRETNTASYGAGAWQYGATAYDDTTGSALWSLTPSNRAQALTPTSDTDPIATSASTTIARAALLSTINTYDPLNPDQLTDTTGPIHPLQLSTGAADARSHTHTSYDEGGPVDANSNPTDLGLPTTATTSASKYSAGTFTDVDSVITRTGYGATAVGGTKTGWDLRQATSSTTAGAGAGGTDLTRNTRYNDTGQVVQSWLPGSTGSDARSTSTAYFTATGTGSCVSAWMAGLGCSTGPTAQPGTGNPLPVTTTTYNLYSQPLVATETAGTTVRTTTSTYDVAGRTVTTAVAVTPTAAGGATVPTTTNGYSSTTGLPTTVTDGSTTMTTGYDTLGRVNSYIDAAGTNSITGYDLSGHAISLNDGKGTTTWTYDSATEHRGLITSEDVGVGSAPGTFTGSYDADASLSVQTYPNGVTATSHYNNTGDATSLQYKQGATTWMSFTQNPDAQGRTATQTSPMSSQNFTYDTAGRLTKTQDTVTTAAPSTLAIDTQASADSTSTGGVISTPTFSTTAADTVIALVSSDGPNAGGQTSTVTGAGLTWTLVTRGNTSPGDTEVWTANSPSALSSVTVSATQGSSGYHQSLSVIALKGSAGIGASAHASASTGAPSVGLITTATGSLVFATGNDYDSATARTLGTGQSLVHEFSDSASGDDFWAQRTTSATGAAGTTVTMNDTAPTGHRWNLSAVEITPSTGTATTLCTTRQYLLDNDSNRTGYASTPGTGTTCTNGTPTTTGTFDGADRITNTGYAYDTLGRTTTVPTADALGIGSHASITGALTVGYYANDLVATQTQGASSLTFALDPLQNRIYSTTAGATTNTNHYNDASDSPAWTSTGTNWTRTLPGIAGDLAGTVDQTGTVTLDIINMHGDIVQPMPDTTGATGPSGTYSESSEYGAPRVAANAPDTYGWLGAKQRSTSALGGVTLMGVRLYNPTTGRFLSVDPVPGGTDNPYVYVLNPTDQFDLNGQSGCWRWCGWGRRAYHQTIRAAAVPAYAVYYGGYYANRYAARHSWAWGFRPTGWGLQAVGIALDAGIDKIKSKTGFHESIYDEHKRGSINPFHRGNGGNTYLPGLYRSNWSAC